MPPIFSRTIFLFAGVACGVVLAGACNARGRAPVPAPAVSPVERFPVQTTTVVVFDFRILRDSVVWKKLAAVVDDDAADRAVLAELRARTGFDPLADVDELALGFPDDARVRGEMGLWASGRHLDERRLVAFARDEAKARGTNLTARPHAGLRLWGTRATPDARGFFLAAPAAGGSGQFFLGRAGWAETMAERAAGRGAPEFNRELGRLADRMAAQSPAQVAAVWLVSVVPPELRRRLAADQGFSAAAAVNRWAASLVVAPGLALRVLAELSTGEDATTLSRNITQLVRAARTDPRVLLLGLAPLLDDVVVRTTGPQVHLSIEINRRTADDLMDRFAAFLRLTARPPGAAGKP